MIWTLKACIGLFLGLCGQVEYFHFPDYESCDRERKAINAKVSEGYAVCYQVKIEEKK